jgi:putative SOS response-associated peptidase YedK
VARAETLTIKPAFRVAIRKRRCLILADGFYEWQKRGNIKQPVRIVLKNRKPFGFAGLWERWKPTAGDELQTCVIITTESNELLKDVHHRMPVILPPDKEEEWLDPNAELTRLLALLKPYGSAEMEYYPVSRAVNSPSHNAAGRIVPI